MNFEDGKSVICNSLKRKEKLLNEGRVLDALDDLKRSQVRRGYAGSLLARESPSKTETSASQREPGKARTQPTKGALRG